MKVKFISLASGSSGNCYYIGTEKYGILIDAGIAVRTIKKSLKEVGIGMQAKHLTSRKKLLNDGLKVHRIIMRHYVVKRKYLMQVFCW